MPVFWTCVCIFKIKHPSMLISCEWKIKNDVFLCYSKVGCFWLQNYRFQNCSDCWLSDGWWNTSGWTAGSRRAQLMQTVYLGGGEETQSQSRSVGSGWEKSVQCKQLGQEAPWGTQSTGTLCWRRCDGNKSSHTLPILYF